MRQRFHRVVFVLGVITLAASARADIGGNPEAGKAKAAVCASCHGIDGNGGADPAWPKLAGQIPEYLIEQLDAFKTGKRKSPIMSPMAAPLSEQDMKDLAAYYAAQEPKPGAAASEELALAGERIHRGGIAEAGVPACMSCHGPAGRGIPPRFPRLHGQTAPYTRKQLRDYKAGQRVDREDMMARIAARLSDGQIEAISEYLAGLH